MKFKIKVRNYHPYNFSFVFPISGTEWKENESGTKVVQGTKRVHFKTISNGANEFDVANDTNEAANEANKVKEAEANVVANKVDASALATNVKAANVNKTNKADKADLINDADSADEILAADKADVTDKTTEILAANEFNVIVEAAVANKSDNIALDEAVDANELNEAIS